MPRDYTLIKLDRKPSPPDERDYRLSDYLERDSAVPPAPSEYADKTLRQIADEGVTWPFWLRLWSLVKSLLRHPPPTPPIPQVAGKVWTDDYQLDQDATGHCHPPGTLVRMADGSHRQIEDVQLFDWVVSGTGDATSVSAILGRQYAGDMIHVRLRGQRDGVRCTPDHPILTNAGYIAAGDLHIGMMVATPSRKFRVIAGEIAMDRIVPRDRWQTTTRRYPHLHGPAVQVAVSAPPETIRLTRSLGKLVGLYLAEGYAKGSAVTRFAFGGHEEDILVQECCDLIRATLQTEPRIQYRANGVIIVNVDGRHWVDFFAAVCGKGAAEKHLALDGPDAYLEGVLDGWIAGDGYERRSERLGVTVSRRLAYDMYGVASDLGYAPTIRRSDGKPSRGVRRRRDRYDVAWGIGDGKNRTPGWRPVVTIERSAYAGPVYNLEVEDDHSFVAQGIAVHNCVGFGVAQWGNTLPVDDQYLDVDGHAVYYEAKAIELGVTPRTFDPPGSGPAVWEDGTYVRDGMKAAQNRGRLAAYARAKNVRAEVVPWLVMHGPVVVGTGWYEGMDNPNQLGVVAVTGQNRGGHCYTLDGYIPRGTPTPEGATHPDRDLIRFQNSWGTGYGLNGYAYISVDDLQHLLDRDGEAWAAVEEPLAR